MEQRKGQQTEIESRSFAGEVRASKEADKMTIGGLAARFDSYTNMGWYVEVIKRGFFDGMDTTKTAALKNHDSNMVLGRTINETLRLAVTDSGLEYEVDLPDTSTGRDTFAEVSRGDIYQSSFQFTVKEAIWREVDRSELAGVLPDDVLDRLSYGGKIDIRELVKGGTLYDVAPVTFPAYQDTTVAKRSHEEYRSSKEPAKVDTGLLEKKIKVAQATANSFHY